MLTRDASSQPVVVTGGAGFIGSHLVDRLLAEGESVIAIDDLSTGARSNLNLALSNPRFRFIESKISEVADLTSLISASSYVFHLAAAVGVEKVMGSPLQTLQTNLGETELLFESAVQGSTPILLTSTSEVYGKNSKPVFSEADDLQIGPSTLCRWSYACSKLMDEFLAMAFHRERGIPVTVVRLFNTVGLRQSASYGMVIPRFMRSARAGLPVRVYGDGQQSRCFCHRADTVEALIRLRHTKAALGRVINVGNDQPITMQRLAEKIVERLGSSSVIEQIPYSEVFGPGYEDMRHRQPSLTLLEELTGFRPQRSLDEIINDLI
ncbi:MAG: NAD-dependent epimerase/dehydratase family protein [Pedosphaera sp.]|nr:NAD-dependent epimerase/dehydratase family protein [Pedosphaera sp.]